ncbi:MAG: hypothetical protein Q8N42_02370 [bacterium]|nr:hypothetical protein [bacterium]
MKAKHVLIVFAILTMAVMFSGCGTGAIGPDIIPKDKWVSVKYVRVQPSDPQSPDRATLNWDLGSTGAGMAGMTKEAEDTFVASAQIKTETKVNMKVLDVRKPDYVCKRLFIDGHELIFGGSEFGSVQFIYRNDGTIEITSPK